MKKSIIALFFVLFVTVATFANYSTDSFQTRPTEFSSVYQKALDLNKNRFKDLNVIQIGDTVLFPARIGSGTEAWIADYPSDGKHDCIWYLTQKYLAGQLVTAPVDTIKVKVTEPVERSKAEQEEGKRNAWWFMLFILAVIAFTIFFTRLLTRRPVDLNRNPMIPGGLSDEAIIALQQIDSAYPNRPRATRIQRGVIRSLSAAHSVTVQMTFSDGVRQVNLQSGETAYRVERVGGVVDFYRQHCGNLFGEISQGGYNLPEGWTFIPIGEDNEILTEVPQAPVDLLETPLPSANDIVKVLKAIRKFKVKPNEIFYGDLMLTFQKEKKRKK